MNDNNLQRDNAAEKLEVAIIGAGFAGVGLGIGLLDQGRDDFAIFEQADDVGGVWRDNRYPGAACDVPSHLYSYSFEKNPEWSRKFSGWSDIHNYIRNCSDRHGLAQKIRFGMRVEAMGFDASRGAWTLEFSNGEKVCARAVVVAIGALNIPQYPDIPGLERFSGKVMHSAEWDTDYSVAGRRVAVIGTGASAIQIIPSIQPEVSQLNVFQRTPPWVMPKFDRPLKKSEHTWFRRLPFLQSAVRALQYLTMEAVVPAFMWDSFLTRLGERQGRRFINSVVTDPVLREKLTPKYSMGCKRVLLSDEYYPALIQDNVEVISDGICRIEENAIVTADGKRHEVDTIVLATGFKVPVAGAPMPVTGLEGRTLAKDWANGVEAYKGISISGYPNMLYMMGPNTGPGNTSVIFYIESQIRYILQYLKKLRASPGQSLEMRPDVQAEFNAKVQRMMRGTTWTSGCNSWYLAPDGRNTTLWPSFSWRYRLTTRHFRLADYYLLAANPAREAPLVDETEVAIAQ